MEHKQRPTQATGAGERNIRDEIVERRRERIRQEGHEFGWPVPAERQHGLRLFVQDPLLICEIKRRSPSRGNLAEGLDPVAQARLYVARGVRSVSILTEEDHFSGSLRDLMAVKAALPELAVLRKDFLVDEEDVRVSWRAGADAVLLIASMLSQERLGAMLKLAGSLGMAALVEVHTLEEIRKVAPFRPALMGINCRNLETFAMDRLLPLRLRPFMDWPCRVVFESGLFEAEDGRYAGANGFAGMLVGEAVVKAPDRIAGLLAGFAQGFAPFQARPEQACPERPFWSRLARLAQDRLAQSAGIGSGTDRCRRPLLKVCGICNREDARAAVAAGADLLGFIFADSPRRCPPGLVAGLQDLDCLKVAVVCNMVPPEVQELLAAGLIDAVQFSGDEAPVDCAGRAWPYYKALRPRTPADLAAMDGYRSPRVLLDAFHEGLYGGSGRQLDPALVAEAARTREIWLAGGINPANVADIVRTWRPELIDLASGVEESPGKKSHNKLAELAREMDRVCI